MLFGSSIGLLQSSSCIWQWQCCFYACLTKSYCFVCLTILSCPVLCAWQWQLLILDNNELHPLPDNCDPGPTVYCMIDNDIVFCCKITSKYGPCLFYSDTAISLHDFDNVGPQKDNDKASHLYLAKTKRTATKLIKLGGRGGDLCLTLESEWWLVLAKDRFDPCTTWQWKGDLSAWQSQCWL